MKNLVVYVLIAAGAFGYNMLTSADRDASGAIVDSGSVDAFNMRVGDCFDDPHRQLRRRGGLIARCAVRPAAR